MLFIIMVILTFVGVLGGAAYIGLGIIKWLSPIIAGVVVLFIIGLIFVDKKSSDELWSILKKSSIVIIVLLGVAYVIMFYNSLF